MYVLYTHNGRLLAYTFPCFLLYENPPYLTSRMLGNTFVLQTYFFFNWRIIALQNFVVFCHTSRISHRYTHVPSLLDFPPYPSAYCRAPVWIPIVYLFYPWYCKFLCTLSMYPPFSKITQYCYIYWLPLIYTSYIYQLPLQSSPSDVSERLSPGL